MNSETQKKEVIVYLLAKKTNVTVGGALPSSFDTYDTEYGWTASDYANASKQLSRDEVRLIMEVRAYLLSTKQDLLIGTRSISNSDRTAGVLIADESKSLLFDGGEYGIYNTFENKWLIKGDGPSFYKPFPDATVVFYLNTNNTNISKDDPYIDYLLYLDDCACLYPDKKYNKPREIYLDSPEWNRFSSRYSDKYKSTEEIEINGFKIAKAKPFKKPFDFLVNQSTYSTCILNDFTEIYNNNELILRTEGVFLDAIGFPESILLEKITQLKKE